MDKHHIAHYGIAVALAAGIGGVVYFNPMAPRTWPMLTSAQALAIIQGFSKIAGGDKTINVYCIDRDCDKISASLHEAGRSSGVKVTVDRPWQAADGVSVGAKTQAVADALAKAVHDGSNGSLKADPVDGQLDEYISFGHFVAE